MIKNIFISFDFGGFWLLPNKYYIKLVHNRKKNNELNH